MSDYDPDGKERERHRQAAEEHFAAKHAHPSRIAPQGEHPETQRQLEVYLAALEGGASKLDAIEQCGLTKRTVNKHLQHRPDFAERERQAIAAWCDTVTSETRDRLLDGVPRMLGVLEDVALDEDAPAAARVSAAREWLDRAGVGSAARVDVSSGGRPLAAASDPVAVANAAQALLEARRNGQ